MNVQAAPIWGGCRGCNVKDRLTEKKKTDYSEFISIWYIDHNIEYVVHSKKSQKNHTHISMMAFLQYRNLYGVKTHSSHLITV